MQPLIKKIFKVLCLIVVVDANAQQPKINMLDSGRKTSIRGLCVVDDNIIWASGSAGSVARSLDGGKTFQWQTVNGYEKRDFRDIEAFDANTAIIMAVAEPAVILKTKDGGKTWYKVFEDTTKGMFLDAMDFDNKGNGVVIGDPVYESFFEALTNDSGEHWLKFKAMDVQNKPAEGEAFFASSGTNVAFTHNKDYPIAYATGGTVSRLFYREKFYPLDMIQGKESTGANSIAIDNSGKNAVIVGGDFSTDTFSILNCVLLKLKLKPEFSHPKTPPHGYRSCVEYISKNKLITCGTSGVDISNDGGMNWKLISTQSFHVCRKAKNGKAVFLAGANGKIAKLKYD